MTDEKNEAEPTGASAGSVANHDAVPAAIAPADSHAPRGAVDRESVGTDKAEPLTRDCGTGDISEAQIDALECVVEDGRIVGMSVYGHLRSLLVRLRPEWESDRPQPVKDDDSDRSKPINDDRLSALEELSAMDQELELKHGITGNPMIKAQQRTPPQGSVQGEGSVRDSRNAKEPVAWHINGSEYDTGCEYEYATLERGIAEAATAEGCVVVPLYRHPQPTLTDEEREAVAGVISVEHQRGAWKWAETLRSLLERLGGER